VSPKPTIRLGGMALANGVLVHGPRHWACAVRDEDGELRLASGEKPVKAVDAGSRLTRGPLRVAEIFALLPEVRRRLSAELDAVLGERRPVMADLQRLSYAMMVVTESMRLYPPAPTLGRDALRDCEVGDHRIPKGSTIVVSPWVVHRDPRFFEDPEAFRPERWSDGLARRLPKFAYFPFGGGPRLCIGSSFALTEAVLLLATIAQRFRLDLVPGHPVKLWPTITLRPRHGMWMTVRG